MFGRAHTDSDRYWLIDVERRNGDLLTRQEENRDPDYSTKNLFVAAIDDVMGDWVSFCFF